MSVCFSFQTFAEFNLGKSLNAAAVWQIKAFKLFLILSSPNILEMNQKDLPLGEKINPG